MDEDAVIPDLPYDDDDEPVVIVSRGRCHTILCPRKYLPVDISVNDGWRAYRVDGTVDECHELVSSLDEVGLDAICFFAFHAKYLVVREQAVAAATAQLLADGIPVFDA